MIHQDKTITPERVLSALEPAIYDSGVVFGAGAAGRRVVGYRTPTLFTPRIDPAYIYFTILWMICLHGFVPNPILCISLGRPEVVRRASSSKWLPGLIILFSMLPDILDWNSPISLGIFASRRAIWSTNMAH